MCFVNMFNFSLKAVIFVCLIYTNSALYEDQVGKFDWKQPYVGKVKYSHIDGNGKRVFVATEKNVVASINVVDGSLLWRKVLETNELGVIHAFNVGNEVITVSGNGPYLLRGWNLKSGVLTYEWILPFLGQRDIEWTIDTNKVHQVRFLKNSLIEVNSYNIKTGSPTGSVKTIEASWLTSSSRCLLDKGVVLCVSPQGSVNSVILSDSSTNSYNLTANASPVEELSPLPSHYTAAILKTSHKKHKAIVIADGSLITEDISPSSSAWVKKGPSGPVIFIFDYNSGIYSIKAKGLISGREKIIADSISYTPKLSDGTLSSMTCLSASDLDCFYLFVGEDDSLMFFEKNSVSWVREEALANVITVEMIDLPVSDEEAAIEKEFANKEGGIVGMLFRRVHSQWSQIIHFISSIIGLKEHSGESQTDLVKDPFGLHKLIIIVTKASKIYGMENDEGDIIWQFHLKDLSPFNVLGEMSVPLFIQRSSRHLPLPSICTVIFKNKNTGLSSHYSFNPINGQPLYGGLINLDYKINQYLQLPKEDKEFIKGLVFISNTNKVHYFPESAKGVAYSLHKTLYVFSVDPDSGLLEGSAFVSTRDKELKVINVWNVQLSPPIIKVAMKNKAEKVHSQGRVLGDRSVLYKYINPHLVAVATHTIDPIHKNLVTIFLIDTVSGAVIFSVVHKRATPPVHIVHSENWIVYSFFNDKSRRTEMISLDLYEGKSQRNSTEFSSLSMPIEPLVERQAYIFPHNVMAMKETITEKGITNKHVLVGVTTGSIIEVPWALLDPHRSPDGREEGVLPYTPDLTMPPEAILTYNHTLPAITGIHTSPSGLESTSLVLIYGLDLFYTRVAPSKTFDVLKDDFEYWLITLVLGGLISAAYITKKLASRKALRQAWK